jgi:GGDEF domain-containing protein
MEKQLLEKFARTLDLELKRAKRYRIFISMSVLDLSFTGDIAGAEGAFSLDATVDLIREHIREIDNVVALEDDRVGLLFPETPRQGAEIASKRLAELIKNSIENATHKSLDALIPVEMVSYPDAAGAKSMTDYLEELLKKRRN